MELKKGKEMPRYGSRIIVNGKYRRDLEMKERGNYKSRFKYWKVEPCKLEGLFLGLRTLSDGWSEWEDECGHIFTSETHYKAALFSPGPNKNPVYVPLSCIE
jgi:hypothetical protein